MRARKSILESIIQHAKADDYYQKGFAMLNCAPFLKDTKLEGDIFESALFYYNKIIQLTNVVSAGYIDEKQKELAALAIDNLTYFTQVYRQCAIDIKDLEKGIEPERLISKIIEKCGQFGYCYLPSGWSTRSGGHYLSIKITKNADNTYDVCFLNRGAGMQHHDQLGQSDEKSKFDYQSHVYTLDLSSKSAMRFFHGVIALRQGVYAESDCNEQDLYGLLALNGKLRKSEANHQRAVTPQRSGTCALTNARAAVKDVLLTEANLSNDAVRRYEFINKLSSIVIAYKHLLSQPDNKKNEADLQLLEIALNELYVRLEKAYPAYIDKVELSEIREYADEISLNVKKFQDEIIEETCKDVEQPVMMIDWRPKEESLPLTRETSEEVISFTAPEERFVTKKCAPEELHAYLVDAHSYFTKPVDSVLFVYEFKKFLHSLEKTSALEHDEYWDKVPENQLIAIIDMMSQMVIHVKCDRDCDKYECALICYDIAAQLARRIPSLQLGDVYTLGLQDLYTYKHGFYEPSTFLTVSYLIDNFIKRSKGKVSLFHHTGILNIQRGYHSFESYILTVLSDEIRQKIRVAIDVKYISDRDCVEIFLTGKYNNKDINIESLLPVELVAIRNLAARCYGQNKSLRYFLHESGRDVSFSMNEHDSPYLKHKNFQFVYGNQSNYHISSEEMKIRGLLPYKYYPNQNHIFRDMAENVIYQPEVTRVKRHKDDYFSGRNKSSTLPWSNDYDLNLQSGALLSGNSDTTRKVIDHELKRVQLDIVMSFQRSLAWLGNNIHSFEKEYYSVEKLLMNIFKYGSIYLALDTASEEAHEEIKNTLTNAYLYYEGIKQELNGIYGETSISNYLSICSIETLYRLWVVELNKADLLDAELPTCQADLRQLLITSPKKNQADIASVVLANLQFMYTSSYEDMKYLLATQLIISHHGEKRFKELTYSISLLAIDSWQKLKGNLAVDIALLSSNDLNKFMRDVLIVMGFEGLSHEYADWSYKDSLIMSHDGRAVVDLNNGQFRINGKNLQNANENANLDQCRYIFRSIGVIPEQAVVIPITASVPVGKCQYQTDAEDGSRIYIEKIYNYNSLASVKSFIKIDNQEYLCDLVASFGSGYSDEKIKKLFDDLKLHNPYRTNRRNSNQVVWKDTNSTLILVQHPKKNNKAMVYKNGYWYRCNKKNNEWLCNGIVLFDARDAANTLAREWGQYFTHVASSANIKLKGYYDANRHTLQLINISIPDLDLRFTARDSKLYCREHPGFYLSTKRGLKELKGLHSMVILENKNGEMKCLLLKSSFHKQGTPIYSRNPISNDAKGYIVVNNDIHGQPKGKTPEDNYRLALIFALQGDYENAMKFLKLSYCYRPNNQTILNLMQAYNECKPDTPGAYAFYFHLYIRFEDHEFKWVHHYNPTHKDQIDKIKQAAALNMQNYLQSISSRREGVNSIPECLLIPDKFIPAPQDNKSNAKGFKDNQYSRTNKLDKIDKDVERQYFINNHQRQNMLPVFPPLRVPVSDEFKDGVNKRGTRVSGMSPPVAYIQGYFVNLFELAISDAVEDTELLNIYLYFILHSCKHEDKQVTQLAAMLRYVNYHKSEFRNAIHDNTSESLVAYIYSKLNIIDNPELFSETNLMSDIHKIEKSPHWRTHNAKSEFSLAHITYDSSFNQPLKHQLEKYCTSLQKTVAVKGETETLKLPSEMTLSPIAAKIISNYEQGSQINVNRITHSYTLSNDNTDKLAASLVESMQNDQLTLKRLNDDIEKLANALPEDIEEYKEECQLIRAARNSGKLDIIDVPMLSQCLLNQDTSQLNHNNPFISEESIKALLQLTCDYILTQSRYIQCKEALKLLDENRSANPLPKSAQQLIGETLAKTRNYNPSEYPELLVYEYATGNMLRDGQAERVIELIKLIENGSVDNQSYEHVLLQFAAGGGKTAVLIPILAKRFARTGRLPIIMNTSELYSIALQEIPDSLKQSFDQNIEVIERELDFQWQSSDFQKLLADLSKWRDESKCLLLKSVTWHSINLAYIKAQDESDIELASNAKQVLQFFANECVKLEDEGHLISDPLQECIRTDLPSQAFNVETCNMMLSLYHWLMGKDEDCTRLAELTGIKEQSKKSVTASELQEIQRIIAEKFVRYGNFVKLDKEQFIAYLLSPDKTRPVWLQSLHQSSPQLADDVIFARSMLQTHLPHILTLQYQRDYGQSIHQGDLTAAPKHDGANVSSHFADPLLVLALTTQMVEQQGVPDQFIKDIFKRLRDKHENQKILSPQLTEAEIQLVSLLPDSYLNCDITKLKAKDLVNDPEVKFHGPLQDYYLKVHAYPQIKVPTKLYVSTPADLQAGFKKSVIFSATPGLPETYPVQLPVKNMLLANEFEAEVISTLLAKKNNQGILIDNVQSPAEFFEKVQAADPEQFKKMTGLIERGALLSNFKNKDISDAILKILEADMNQANSLYFDEDGMRLDSRKLLKPTDLQGTRIIQALQEQGYSLEDVMIFLFLDLAHTTGTDVKRPYHDRAGLTVGKEQTMTDTIQAAMRERQLLREDAQSIVWILFKSLYSQIKPDSAEFDLNEVFIWMIQNQARHNEHKVLMRAYHGLHQIVKEFAEIEVTAGRLNSDSIKHTLSKQIRLSIWDMYEQINFKADTEVVLNDYLNKLCQQYKLDRQQMPAQLASNTQRIIHETKLLIPEIYSPRDSELNGEVVHEQHQHVEQAQQQQQEHEQKSTLLNRFNRNANVTMSLEIYNNEDNLESIFDNLNQNYRTFSLPGCDAIKMPGFLMNPRHFSPIQQADYQQVDFIKPVDNLIIQCLLNGEYRYLACSSIGLKFFRKQMEEKVFEANDPSYIIVDGSGKRRFKSSNCTKATIAQCLGSTSYQDMVCYVELLNGHIDHPEKMCEFIKRYQISAQDYQNLVSSIKQVHVAPSPVELENLPYFESLCGWRELDDRIKHRLANKAGHHKQLTPVVTKPVAQRESALPQRAVPGYMPDPMVSLLPPCVIGLETRLPNLPTSSDLPDSKQPANLDQPVPRGTYVDPTIEAVSFPPTKLTLKDLNPAQLRDLVKDATSKYTSYHKNENRNLTTRGSRGFFTSIRHGKKGLQKAKSLNDDIKDDGDILSIMGKLDEFLTDNKTRYHRHSLSSFILDEFSTLLENLGKDRIPVGKEKSNLNKYDPKIAWLSAKFDLSYDDSKRREYKA